MRRSVLLVLALARLSFGGTIEIDSNTTLLDGSLYTPGNAYYAAFQLFAGGPYPSSALLSDFQVAASVLERSPGDLTVGLFEIGPDAIDPGGIWQPAGTLTLTVGAGSAFALYMQQIWAPAVFSFVYEFDGGGPGVPTQFAFQLYSSGLDELLYEVALDLPVDASVPEPSPTYLIAAAGAVAILWRNRLLRRRVVGFL